MVDLVSSQIEGLDGLPDVVVHRHKTAIRRAGLSVPVRFLLEYGLLNENTTFLDYGCGRGYDLELLTDAGISGSGWDPVHRPSGACESADVVNLGYVINVIEDPRERATALKRAWSLAQSVFIVSAQTTYAAGDREHAPYSDGVLTSRGTFQKYYTQTELRGYLESQLEAEAVAAAPGIFVFFRDDVAQQRFMASRFRRRVSVPVRSRSELSFEKNADLLDPLIAVIAELGRLPSPEEFELYDSLVSRLGSIKRAYRIVQKVTDPAEWEAAAKRRTEDLLVYLALSRFGKRPRWSQIPPRTQLDVKAFFGTYLKACADADKLLYSISASGAVEAACVESTVGVLSGNGLYILRTDVDSLSPILRTFEGCARALCGDITAADVVKLHVSSSKVSYMQYDVDDNIPRLDNVLKVSLRDLRVTFWHVQSDSVLDFDASSLLLHGANC